MESRRMNELLKNQFSRIIKVDTVWDFGPTLYLISFHQKLL